MTLLLCITGTAAWSDSPPARLCHDGVQLLMPTMSLLPGFSKACPAPSGIAQCDGGRWQGGRSSSRARQRWQLAQGTLVCGGCRPQHSSRCFQLERYQTWLWKSGRLLA